jgi:hypothetical protein
LSKLNPYQWPTSRAFVEISIPIIPVEVLSHNKENGTVEIAFTGVNGEISNLELYVSLIETAETDKLALI